MPVIPEANFNQTISLGTQSKDINPQAMGLVGDAVANLGKTAFDIGIDVQEKITKADAVDFTYENSNKFHEETSAFTNKINERTQSDGRLLKGDTLDDGTIIDSENPYEMIQKFQDKKISEVSKNAKTNLQKEMFESTVRSTALGNVLHAQGKQFKDNIEFRVKKVDDFGNALANKATALGASKPFRPDGTTSVGELNKNIGEYKSYLDEQVKTHIIGQAIADKQLKNYGALAQDNFHNGMINQINSGTVSKDADKKQLLNTGKEAIRVGVKNGTIEPAMVQKYVNQVAVVELNLFKDQQRNLEADLDAFNVVMLESGEVSSKDFNSMISKVITYGHNERYVHEKTKELVQSAQVALRSKEFMALPPSQRTAAMDDALKGADEVAEKLAKNFPQINPKLLGIKNKEGIQKAFTKQFKAWNDEMLADPVAFDFKANSQNYITDLDTINNPYSSAEDKRNALDKIIKTTKEHQATILETPLNKRRSLSKEMVAKLSSDMIESAKNTTLTGSDMINDQLLNNYSQAALFEVLDQSVKDGTSAYGKQGFDPLYKSVYHFPNRDSMNKISKLVAGKADLERLWKDSGKKSGLVDGDLQTANSEFFSALRAKSLGGSDLALQNSFNQVGKLYMKDQVLSGKTVEEAKVAWKNELNQNYKVINTARTSFFVPSGVPTEPIQQWAEQFTDTKSIEKYLKDTNAVLPPKVVDYAEYANTIVNSGGKFVSNSSSTGVWLKFNPKPSGLSQDFVAGPHGRPLEITFEAMSKRGVNAKPDVITIPQSEPESDLAEAQSSKDVSNDNFMDIESSMPEDRKTPEEREEFIQKSLVKNQKNNSSNPLVKTKAVSSNVQEAIAREIRERKKK